jgi:hypothetical protein
MKEFLTEAQIKQMRDRVQAVVDRLAEIKIKQDKVRERTKLKSNNSLREELGSNPGHE